MKACGPGNGFADKLGLTLGLALLAVGFLNF
jgi:hypothetical protein